MGDNQKNGGNSEEPEQFRKLFIGGLSLNTTDDTLKEFYGKYGTILDSVVMRDGATKKSRGFGFITYSAKTEVDSAMSSRPHVIDGKTVDPKRAVPRDQSSRGEANVSTQRLYVSGVREDHQEQQFKDYFGDYGTVTKVEIITDKASGKPRGFGFITFDDYDAVDKCVLAKSHMINGFRCDVKKALSRDEMAKAQQSDRDRMDRGMRTRGGGRGGNFGGNFREPHGYGGGPSGGGWSNQNWQGQGQWNSGGGYGNAPQQYGGPAGGQWSGGNDNWNNSQQGGGYNQWGQQGGYQQQAPQGWGGNNSNNWKGGNRY
ncbi:Heterogeneous ribonuclear particle protein [Aphelenchoides bicaudatus]|nr:Heterogeneous ribonuclear particle protein [Aphelenchoides bicaudatus]